MGEMTDVAAAPIAFDPVDAPTTDTGELLPGIPAVSVVIPTLNEAGNLPHVLPRIPSWIHELIVVDGLSTDDTVAVTKSFAPRAKVVMVSTPGKGAALRAGFAAATGDIVVMLDADGSTDPQEIPAFVGLLLAGADVVMGSRFTLGGGTDDMERHRKMENWALTRLVRFGFGARFSDLCYGYTAFWRDVLPVLNGPFRGFEVETVMHIRAVRAGLRIAEVPSFESIRISGSTNLRTVRDGFRVLRAIGTEWALEHVIGTDQPVRPERRHARPLQHPPWHANGRSVHRNGISESGPLIRSVPQ
jgi:glycosyltransferase involved in cell wall biosynthesis